LKRKVVGFSDTLVNVCNTTRHHISADSNFCNYLCQNLRLHLIMPVRLPSIGLYTHNVETKLTFVTFIVEEAMRAQRRLEV
jgi:hypothetical protein